jgi:hypothetical protein
MAKASISSNHHLNLGETVPVFFSKGVPLVDMILAVCFLVKMRHNNHSGWTAVVYLTSFFLSLCMHAVGRSIIISKQLRWRGIVAYMCTVLRMLSAAALLIFLDYRVHSVAVLPPFALVLLLAAALSWLTFGSSDDVGLNWGHFKQELELGFNLSAKVVSMAFAGLAGRVLGSSYSGAVSLHDHNHKQQAPTSRVRVFMAVAPECFLFYGLVLGLLLMLHCTVPSHIIFLRTRRRVAKVYKPLLAYVALLLIILAIVLAAEDILRMNVFFVCCVVVANVVVYCLIWGSHHRAKSVEQQQDSHADIPRKDHQQDAQQCVLTAAYFATLFSLIIATHSRHCSIIHGATTVPPSWLLKSLLFWGLCSILVYVARVVLLAEMRGDGKDDRGGWAISCTTYATYGTMTITCVCMVLVLSLKFGELKNIVVS